ncbi:SDR family oxidoreductase [Streptomyces coelicoflavus]|uniref:SDR family oxidoreductase n=1 Tax=Streptomyces coelicoflavus TaxID=285562 RepID=A0A7K3PKQ8_9ACTN|nr:SDR family oxidoreductase [Streptomyces coelicoflavus]NEB09505.1 SDR family oxidoreductase [Streptomyces coelicoflavus]
MATKVLILGAGGQIARWAVEMLEKEDVELTLLARSRDRLAYVPTGAHVVQGNVLDTEVLDKAVRGQDVVYANLAGDLDVQAEHIVTAMRNAGVRRLIFVTALGIHDEVPGEFGRWNTRTIGAPVLDTYRRAAETVAASGLDHTILRPAWLSDEDEIDFETTNRNEPFKGTVVSRKSVAALAVEIIKHPAKWVGANLGVDKPGTDGDRPVFG